MQVRNFVTGKGTEFGNTTSVTTDKLYLDKKVFDRACAYHRKGILHSEEVLSFLKDSKRFSRMVYDVLNRCAYASRNNHIPMMRIVQEVKDKEKEIAINRYKKVPEVLNLEEQLDTMESAISEIDMLRNETPHASSNQEQERGTMSHTIERFIKNRWLAILMPEHHTLNI